MPKREDLQLSRCSLNLHGFCFKLSAGLTPGLTTLQSEDRPEMELRTMNFHLVSGRALSMLGICCDGCLRVHGTCDSLVQCLISRYTIPFAHRGCIRFQKVT